MDFLSLIYILAPGQHRSAALSALKYKKIPVRLKQIVRYEDAQVWPNVLNNTYTEDQAKYIFNQIFEGRSFKKN